MTVRFHLAVVALSLSLTAALDAQPIDIDSMDVLRSELDVDKKAVIASNLMLTETEAEKFWPVYDEYQRELRSIDERLVKLLSEYADAYESFSITNSQAQGFITAALELEDAEVELRKRTLAKLDGVVPAIEAARYLQIENKIRAVIRYDLADLIPLVD